MVASTSRDPTVWDPEPNEESPRFIEGGDDNDDEALGPTKYTSHFSYKAISQSQNAAQEKTNQAGCDRGRAQGWKPGSMSPFILLFMTAATLLMIGIIEFLAQRTKQNGGLALSPSFDKIPKVAMLAYLYLPNIIADVFILLWSWIDLDVKRMQPWLELSKPEGATGADSLLLKYPSEFAFAVPIRAAQRRHWPTFFSACIVVIVMAALAPLQSAILGLDIVSVKVPTPVRIRAHMSPSRSQYDLMDKSIAVRDRFRRKPPMSHCWTQRLLLAHSSAY